VTRLAAIRRRLGLAGGDALSARAIGLAPAAIGIPINIGIRLMTETFSSEAAVPTKSGSRYLQQLCKHWAHNLTVEFTPERGTIAFPKDVRGADYPGDALVTMDARDDALDVRIDATSPAQRDNLKEVVARHLDRFAFREAPLAFAWRDL
jgi:uncharacterized protein